MITIIHLHDILQEKPKEHTPKANIWIDYLNETVPRNCEILKEYLPTSPLMMYVCYSGKLQRGFISASLNKSVLPMWTMKLDYAANKESLDSIVDHLKSLEQLKPETGTNIYRFPTTPKTSSVYTHKNTIISVDILWHNKQLVTDANKEPCDTNDKLLYFLTKNEWYIHSVYDEFNLSGK
ncbi:MAG: hypothetical protein WC916_03550 [Candidatus Woesearchaeota archaeon]